VSFDQRRASDPNLLFVSGISRNRRRRGQGNTEYVIIVALIAIATIAVVTLFGDNIRRLFGVSADELGGDTDIGNPNVVKASGAMTEKNVSNFANQSSTYDPNGMPTRTGPSSNSASGPRSSM
jgi:pilus assembly protein Flp/PilA